METDRKVEAYLNGRWQSQKAYYSKQSSQNKRRHQVMLLLASIGALIVPFLLGFEEIPNIIPAIISLTVGIATILENVFRFGDNWLNSRRAAEALKRERSLYDAQVYPYNDESSAFGKFVRRVESVVSAEVKDFIQTQDDAHEGPGPDSTD
jgi:hypothetical protein